MRSDQHSHVMRFPRGFTWGTATAAHQVEGNNWNNQWSAWEKTTPERFFQRQVAGRACGWWDGQAEPDVLRMRQLHNNSHRLSVEWSRVEPEPGRWDESALERYRLILKAMHRAGIRPMITLHHFTNPLWVEEQGGWANPETVNVFQRFAEKVVARLGDLCTLWCTVNEPTLCAGQEHADYRRLLSSPRALKKYFTYVANLLRAHARAYLSIHTHQPAAQVGLAHRAFSLRPANPRRFLDRKAARFADRMANLTVMEALQAGLFRPPLGRALPITQLRSTLDWMGVNYYDSFTIAFDPLAPSFLAPGNGEAQGDRLGARPWGVFDARGMYTTLVRFSQCFGKPIYITENGMADADDGRRPAFILEHLREIWRAVRLGIPVLGYYHWSLIDNFEWGEAYDPNYRFGLFAVDFATQERTLKNSGRLYGEICAKGALSGDLARRYAPSLADTYDQVAMNPLAA